MPWGGIDNYKAALSSVDAALNIRETFESHMHKSEILYAMGGGDNYEAAQEAADQARANMCSIHDMPPMGANIVDDYE